VKNQASLVRARMHCSQITPWSKAVDQTGGDMPTIINQSINQSFKLNASSKDVAFKTVEIMCIRAVVVLSCEDSTRVRDVNVDKI
jgi:hypothetical protein